MEEPTGESKPWELLLDGWELVRPHWKLFLGAVAFQGFVLLLCMLAFSRPVYSIINFGLNAVFGSGMAWCLMRAHYKRPLSWEQLFDPITARPVAIPLLEVVKALLVLGCGLLAVLVKLPALAWVLSLAVSFALFFPGLDLPILLTQPVGVFGAIGLSLRIVGRHPIPYLIACSLFACLNALGAVFVGVGLVITLPICRAAQLILALRVLEAESLLEDGHPGPASAGMKTGATWVATALGVVILAPAVAAAVLFKGDKLHLPWAARAQAPQSHLPSPEAPPEAPPPASPSVGAQGQWVALTPKVELRVLNSIISLGPSGPELRILWQVRGGGTVNLQDAAASSSFVTALAHGGRVIPGAQIVHLPAPGAEGGAGGMITRISDVAGVNARGLAWGVAGASGQALATSVHLSPIEVRAASLDKLLHIPQDFAPPALPWEPKPADLLAQPALSVLARTPAGCVWLRENAQHQRETLAQLADCDVSIAVSGDGQEALITLLKERRVLLRNAAGALVPVPTPADSAPFVAAFDPDGRVAILSGGADNATRRAVFRDGAWAQDAAVPREPEPALPTHLSRRARPDLRPFHCRLVQSHHDPALAMPLSMDACTTPDPVPYDGPLSERSARLDAPLAAIGSAAGSLYGRFSVTSTESPPLLRDPLLVVSAQGAFERLPHFPAELHGDGLQVFTRGPYALVTARRPDKHVVYDMRRGAMVSMVPDEVASVALWPLAGGPPGRVAQDLAAAAQAKAEAAPPKPARPGKRRAAHRGHRGR